MEKFPTTNIKLSFLYFRNILTFYFIFLIFIKDMVNLNILGLLRFNCSLLLS